MKSYSQAGQDIFVYNLMKGNSGKFLDLGCFLPKKINNTYLLELNGWDGVSLDIQDLSQQWNERTCKFIKEDCLSLDYNTFLPQYYEEKVIDYLTLDMERCGDRFALLKKVMETEYEFKIITIEHDAYLGENFVQQEKIPQRQLLESKGYKLLCGDISQTFARGVIFEDWWVKPEYFDESELNLWISDNQCCDEVFKKMNIPYEIADESK
jgi:hypothetical protein